MQTGSAPAALALVLPRALPTPCVSAGQPEHGDVGAPRLPHGPAPALRPLTRVSRREFSLTHEQGAGTPAPVVLVARQPGERRIQLYEGLSFPRR